MSSFSSSVWMLPCFLFVLKCFIFQTIAAESRNKRIDLHSSVVVRSVDAEGWVSAGFNSLGSLRSVTFHYLFTSFLFTTIRQTVRVLASTWGLSPPSQALSLSFKSKISLSVFPSVWAPLSLSGSE